MEITRNVILDLLPLYVADEVSADTKALVEKYLETDEDLAKVAKQLAPFEKPKAAPRPLSQDVEMRAYKRVQRRQIIFAIALAGVLSILGLAVLMFFLAPA
jgi:hypothetical protein